MVLEKSILIDAPLRIVWDTITTIVNWKKWSTVMRDVSYESERLTIGKSFRFRMSLFDIPIHVMPTIDEIIPERRIVWSGRKYGVLAQHEFTFQLKNNKVQLTSRETFSGISMKLFNIFFPKKEIHELSTNFLDEIKEAAETSNK